MARHLTVLAHAAPTPANLEADPSDHSAPLALVDGPPLASAAASERAGPAAGARAESQGDTFTDGERQALLAVARAVIPAGEVLPAGGARAVAQVERFFGQTPAAVLASYRAALGLLRGAARLRRAQGDRRSRASDRKEVAGDELRAGPLRPCRRGPARP